jgi:hypothetical protein
MLSKTKEIVVQMYQRALPIKKFGRLRGLNSLNQMLFHLGFEDGRAHISLLSDGLNNANSIMSNNRIQITNNTNNAHSLIGP